MQPNVRDLQSLIAEQQAGLKPQLGLIDQDIQANDNSGQAQIAGLGAQQQQAFGQIEQGAQNKGMFFSGFSPDQQAKYTGSTYLPALAQLQATIAGTRSNLLGKKADVNKGAFDKATQMRDQDLAVLADWQKMTAQQQYSAAEAEKQRVFEAHQNEQNRRVTASRGGRAGGGTSAPTLSKNKAGGWDVSQGLDLAGYARATGADLITLLAQGDSQDRQAAQWYVDKINKYGSKDADKYFQELQRDRPTAFYRGG